MAVCQFFWWFSLVRLAAHFWLYLSYFDLLNLVAHFWLLLIIIFYFDFLNFLNFTLTFD